MFKIYRLEKEITLDELFDGRLVRSGIHEELLEGKDSGSPRLLTDGHSQLWAYGDKAIMLMSRVSAGNNPGYILDQIASKYDTYVYSENDPHFFGFRTPNEFDDAVRTIHEKLESEFYVEIIRYAGGLPHGLLPKSAGMEKANIAKKLIANDPDLALPDNKELLMEEVEYCLTIDSYLRRANHPCP